MSEKKGGTINKPNAYLGLHEIQIAEVSCRYEEGVYDSFEGQPVQVSPEDLYFTIGLILDNGLPFDLHWPSDDLESVCDCFGVRNEDLLDRNCLALLGLMGKGNFYCLKFKTTSVGPICALIKKA